MTPDTETGEITTRSELLPAVVEQTAVPAMTLPEMAHALTVAEHFKHKILRHNVDYGVIPGVKKPSLWKPGAERAQQLFGLGHRCVRVEIERDANGERVGVTYRCEVFKSLADGREVMLASCEGYAGHDEAKWKSAPWNTILKMADKRAFVGAVLKATGLSDFFTQDVEDFEERVSPHQPRQPEPAGPMTLRPETLAKITEALERDKVPDDAVVTLVQLITHNRTDQLAEVYEGKEFTAFLAAKRQYIAARASTPLRAVSVSDATPAEPEEDPEFGLPPHDLPDVVEGLGRERVQRIRANVDPDDTRPCTPPQRTNVNVICTKLGHKKQEDRLRALSAWLGRTIESSNDLAYSEASAIIDACQP